jgi:hypothetical protein
MRARLAVVACLFSIVLPAQVKLTVAQLSEFIKSAVQLKQDDRKVAEYLKKVQLSEQLTDLAVEEMQSLGAGPRTVIELHNLRDATASLSAPKPPAPKPVYIGPPPPDSIAQKRVLDEVKDYALNYSNSLPDFICVQVTRRYVDPAGLQSWMHTDTITERLSYFEKHEDYKVVLVNNRAVDMSHEKLGGATSSGEFGTMLREIFAGETGTEFEWDRWATLRGRRMHVFAYRVSTANSKYRITEQESHQSIITGYKGLIYVDRETRAVMKITLESEDIPASFPIRDVHLSLDYEFQKIGEREFILPLKADLTSRVGPKALIRNDVEFRMYRKFTAESTIKAIDFEPPDALPPDATTEQPGAAPPKPPKKQP